MIQPPVILASASPRRRELLALIGIPHEVIPSNIDETYLPGEAPRTHAERRFYAMRKAARLAIALTGVRSGLRANRKIKTPSRLT